MKHYPIKSITADNGSEFALLNEINGIDVYFAHAYSSHKQEINEHFNLLREYIPKDISINKLSEEDLEAYTQAINNRPRKIHNYQSAQKLFDITRTA